MAKTGVKLLFSLGIDNPTDFFLQCENIEDEFKLLRRAYHKRILVSESLYKYHDIHLVHM